MPLREPKFKRNQSILKIYDDGQGNKKIKVINMNVLRTSGIEGDKFDYAEKGSVNDEKLHESLVRTKSKIFELAFCNPWQWFFTGTLKPSYDRENLVEYRKTLSQWIRNYKKSIISPI